MNNMMAVVNVDLGPAPIAAPVQGYQQPVYQQPQPGYQQPQLVYQQPQPIPVGGDPPPNPQFPNPQFPPPMGGQFPQPGGGFAPPPNAAGYDSIFFCF